MIRNRLVGSTIVTGAVMVASLTVSVGTASADPPLNYGHCVTSGLADPSTGAPGPVNTQAASSTGKYPGAINATFQSNGNNRFAGAAIACANPNAGN